jgi:O-antigen/teichoic acid export membrane protein
LTAVLLQWSMRFIGLISVLVLARLLTPADFGIIGVAMATVALVEILGAIGLRQALLRQKDPTRAHFDTAWTIQLLLFSALGLVTLAVAPLAGALYQDRHLTPVLALLSLRFVFLGLVNIGVVEFDRNLQFGRDMRMRLFARLGAFLLTLGSAVLLRNYWALVVGLLSQSALLAIGSYWAHPYRPRFCLSERAALLGISLWMLVSWTAQTAQAQVERLVAAAVGGAHLTGLYSVSKDLAEIFTQEISTALERVTFVTIASSSLPLHQDEARLTRILGGYAMIAAPMGFGLAATAEPAVAVLLGAAWVEAAPLLTIIAGYSAFYSVYRVIASTLTAAGFARPAALLSITGAVVTGTAVVSAGAMASDGLVVAEAAFAGNFVLLLVGVLVLARHGGTGWLRLITHAVRPFLAAALMFAGVRLLVPDLGWPIATLAADVSFGAALYVSLLALVWWAFGRPEGAETEAFTLIRSLAAKIGLGSARPPSFG